MSEPEAILHIEDDPAVTRALVRELAGMGYRIVAVATCASARDVSARFRLGIFDLDLLDGDGVELAETLLVKGTVQRVVFYTGSQREAALERARSVGAVLVKGAIGPLLEVLPLSRDEAEPASRVEGPESPKQNVG